MDKKIRQADSRVCNVIAMLSYSLSEILMYNSLDELSEDLRPLCSLTLTVVFRQGKDIQTKNCSKSLRMGAEFYNKNLVEELCSQVTDEVDALFEASRPQGGVMNVVMGAGASGILLHELWATPLRPTLTVKANPFSPTSSENVSARPD